MHTVRKDGYSETGHPMTALERNLLGVTINKIPQLFPGLFVVTILAFVSIWLSRFLGENLMGFKESPVSPVMIAILLGLGIRAVVPLPQTLKPGLTFAVKKVLRLGIILLGIRLTIFDIFRFGAYGLPIVILCVLGALFVSTSINKRLRLPERLGVLIAVGTSICGVSAIVAAGPAIDATEEESAYAVAVITVFGLLAIFTYPYLAHLIFVADAIKVGLFLGTSVHDTSQVISSAKVYADVFSETLALDVATVTKLVRNVLMPVIIPFMAYFYNRKTQSVGRRPNITKLLPFFVVGFLVLAGLRSLGDAGINADGRAFRLWGSSSWITVVYSVKAWAGYCLVAALAGVGLSTDFRTFKGLGAKPFFAGLCAALAVGVISFVAISLLGSYVVF